MPVRPVSATACPPDLVIRVDVLPYSPTSGSPRAVALRRGPHEGGSPPSEPPVRIPPLHRSGLRSSTFPDPVTGDDVAERVGIRSRVGRLSPRSREGAMPPCAVAWRRGPHEGGSPPSEPPVRIPPLHRNGLRLNTFPDPMTQDDVAERVGIRSRVGRLSPRSREGAMPPCAVAWRRGPHEGGSPPSEPPVRIPPLHRSGLRSSTFPDPVTGDDVAERVGFEPTDRCRSTVFETARFGHSRTSPQ